MLLHKFINTPVQVYIVMSEFMSYANNILYTFMPIILHIIQTFGTSIDFGI